MEEIKELFSWIDQNPLHLETAKKKEKHELSLDFSTNDDLDMYSLEQVSVYMFHQIFCNTAYSMGKKIKVLMTKSKEFHKKGQKEKDSVAIGCINEIGDEVLSNFNCSRKELSDILCFCRISVENCYHFSKFKLNSKREVERSLVKTDLLLSVPLTLKCMWRLNEEMNSQKIVLNLFLLKYVFELECESKEINEETKLEIARKLGEQYSKELATKVKTLENWNFNREIYESWIKDFQFFQ